MEQINQILVVGGLCGDNNIAYNGLIIKLHDGSGEIVIDSVNGART